MHTILDLFSVLLTGIGLFATVVILCLLRNGTRYVGLAMLHWWLLAFFAGVLVFDAAYALGWIDLPMYSLGRRVPGRLCPAVGVACFVWSVVQRRNGPEG